MSVLQLLVKPASSSCQFRCEYCFYSECSPLISQPSYGLMTEETMDHLIDSAFSYPTTQISFAFQGGEPLLVGLNYFNRFVATVNKKNNGKKIRIDYSIQTNGYLINDNWAQFFHDNHFLVGISLDGTQETNDANRVNFNREGTYSKIIESTTKLDKYNVQYNILTVVTNEVAESAKKIYYLYKSLGFKYQQYIPLLHYFSEDNKLSESIQVNPLCFNTFLIELFDCYKEDMLRGEYVYIWNFDNYEGIIEHIEPNSCMFAGHCSRQLIIESNGDVYPCDFYVNHEHYLGNINYDSLIIIHESSKRKKFLELSIPEKCLTCKWGFLCRGGCKRYGAYHKHKGVNYYCEAYYSFFEYAYQDMVNINQFWLSKITDRHVARKI